MTDRIDCKSCRHQVQYTEYSYSAYVGVKRHLCKKFGRSNQKDKIEYLSCKEAYDTFCRGGDWSPRLRARVWQNLVKIWRNIS